MLGIEILIEAKPELKDPEGATICRDLLNKNGFGQVRQVRAAKLLRFVVDATDRKEAEKVVLDACRDLRLFNPVSHTCRIMGVERPQGAPAELDTPPPKTKVEWKSPSLPLCRGDTRCNGYSEGIDK